MKFFSVTCATGLFLLSVLTNALPNPAALPDTPAEGGLEIVARADANEAVIVHSGDEAGTKLATRAPQYCFVGWDQVNYQGNWARACCVSDCCWFYNDLLNNRLYSAKSTLSTTGGVRLWTSDHCTGESRWVDSDGWWNLGQAPAYYSMSLQ
ncbi:hypothetical protein EV426DRAFT_597081 [Tirmania nivea]|nr:hypothetical protein EV426DRAFT_597081 [Tirmania nivea]